jgi:hypothetical protein
VARTIRTGAPEAMKMSVTENRVQRRRSAQIPELSEKAVIAAVALAFLFLHILAGTILQNAAASRIVTPQQETQPSLYD